MARQRWSSNKDKTESRKSEKMMKTRNCFNCLLVLVLTFTSTTRAVPLQKGLVPDDAKWLIHLDLDSLRESKLGDVVLNQMLAGPLAQLKTEMKVDGQLILQKVHSITAFGNDFKAGPKANGVLLLNGEEETRKIVEGFLAAQDLQDTKGSIKKLQQDPFVLYSINDEIFVAPRLAGQIVVSKSRKQIEEVRNILSDKARIAGHDPFSGYAKAPDNFYLLAVAEGFNENAGLPPQAKILNKADGARLLLGEKTDMLFLNLALKAKDSDIIQQIRQVIEGMTALVALGQSENKELLELVQATKVSSNEKSVTVNIEYPLSKVFGHLEGVSQHLQKNLGKPSRAKHAKSKPEKSAD